MRLRRSRMLRLVILASVFGLTAVTAAAQTPYVPYFNKNKPRYDKFDWHIYKTDHFEIYFYPALQPHLERVAGYAESAYAQISADLKKDLAERVPLMLFKTQSEFQENNIAGDTPEGVLAFAEPERNRMVLPIDEPPDQLYRLITHELTHVFEFDIVPRGLGALPLWMDEGLANYMAGYWNVLDLMQVRDAALTDTVPKMSQFEAAPLSGRLPYSLGHATFEFIESRWGKEGVRQFLFSLRKSVLGGSDSAYEEALKLSPEDFDEAFDRYLKERFKAFRDKEKPVDYGRDLLRGLQHTPFVAVVSIEPSPTGDMLAAVVGNRKDQELDIAIISAKDGQVIRNLTSGFDKDRGFEYISTAGGLRGNLVPFLAWSPVGDRIAYFVRTEKNKTLIIQNYVTGHIEQRLHLNTVDGPESPAFSPDGRTVAFAALQNGIMDIYTVNLASGALTNLTKDTIADYAPTFALDGRSIVYTARTGSNDKLFQLDLSTLAKTQLTFGAHDDTAAKFFDDHTLVFTSTAIDPAVDVPAEVARNANIPNVWTLDLTSGELKQWTDTMTGNVSPVVIHESGSPLHVAFISYFKGTNSIHFISGGKPIATVAKGDFGGPGPVFEFTPPISHTLVQDNIRKKGRFEKMMLAGRPPLNLGVSSSGNFYGNTEVTFNDVLGDKEFSFFLQSVSQYRTISGTYVNAEHRMQYAIQGFSQDQFYYGYDLTNSGALYDPTVAPFITRDLAESVSTQRGGTLFAIYPFNRYTRAEMFGGYMWLNEYYVDPALQQQLSDYQTQTLGQPVFRNGNVLPFGVSLVNETTIFREYGPVAGRTYKITYSGSPPLGGNWISRNTLDGDIRYYQRLASNGVLAFRFRGLKSWGQSPDLFYFGGNSELRGYDYLQFFGQKGFFSNAELRFPLIDAMLTPLGVLGGLRGVFFAGLGSAGLNGQPIKVMTSATETVPYIQGYTLEPDGTTTTRVGAVTLSGFRLQDGRASYGFGLETFLLGFPMHFDWSWRTLFDQAYENTIFRTCAQTSPTSIDCVGNSATFRRGKFDFWIGYDF